MMRPWEVPSHHRETDSWWVHHGPSLKSSSDEPSRARLDYCPFIRDARGHGSHLGPAWAFTHERSRPFRHATFFVDPGGGRSGSVEGAMSVNRAVVDDLEPMERLRTLLGAHADHLRDALADFDQHGLGRISAAQLQRGIYRALGREIRNTSHAALNALVQALCEQSGGSVRWRELCTVLEQRVPLASPLPTPLETGRRAAVDLAAMPVDRASCLAIDAASPAADEGMGKLHPGQPLVLQDNTPVTTPVAEQYSSEPSRPPTFDTLPPDALNGILCHVLQSANGDDIYRLGCVSKALQGAAITALEKHLSYLPTVAAAGESPPEPQAAKFHRLFHAVVRPRLPKVTDVDSAFDGRRPSQSDPWVTRRGAQYRLLLNLNAPRHPREGNATAEEVAHEVMNTFILTHMRGEYGAHIDLKMERSSADRRTFLASAEIKDCHDSGSNATYVYMVHVRLRAKVTIGPPKAATLKGIGGEARVFDAAWDPHGYSEPLVSDEVRPYHM